MVIRWAFSYLFFLTLFGQTNLYAQNEIPELTDALRESPTGSMERVDLLNQLGYQYWIVDPNESLRYGSQALALADSLQYLSGMAFAERVLGVSYWTQGELKTALEFLTQSEERYNSIGDAEGAANALMNTGMVYADIGQYHKALEIFDRSVQSFTQQDLEQRVATTFTKMGSAYLDLGRFEQAEEYLSNALGMHETAGFTYGSAEAHNRLARLYLLTGKLELATYHIDRSVDLGGQVNDADGYISNRILEGQLLRERSRYPESEEALLEAIDLASPKHLNKYLLEAYAQLRDLKREQGDLEATLNYYDRYSEMRDSIYDIRSTQQIAALEFGRELALQEKEIALLEERQQRSRLINWLLGMGGLVFLALGIIIYIYQRQRATRDRELLESREALARADLENARLREGELQQQITFKDKELTSYTLNFIQKNELLEEVREQIRNTLLARNEQRDKLLNQMDRSLRRHVQIDQNWDDFRKRFEEVHTDFYNRLLKEHPDLSPNDLKICTLIRLNLSIKEASSVMGISPESVKTARYRLRKKLDLQSEEDLLHHFLKLENA